MSFQDMVLHANNGVLLPPVMEVLPEGGAVNSTSNDLGNWNTQVVDDTLQDKVPPVQILK